MADTKQASDVIIAANRPLIRESIAALASRANPRTRTRPVETMDGLKSAAILAASGALAIVCLRLPGLHGVSGLHQLRSLFPSLNILVICEQSLRGVINDLFAAGASGVVSLESSSEEFLAAIGMVAAGARYAPQDLIEDGAATPISMGETPAKSMAEPTGADPIDAADPLSGLTTRQSEVLHWLLRGASNKEIARHIKISPHTVNMHVRAIFRALGVHSRQEALFVIAARQGQSGLNHTEMFPDRGARAAFRLD